MANPFTASIRALLEQQGKTFNGSDDDLTVALGNLNRPEILAAPGFRDDYDAIRQANAPSTLGGIANVAANAFDRSRQALNVIGGIGETDAGDIADAERRIQSRPLSVAFQDWNRLEGSEAAKAFLRDPVEITSSIIASGFAGSLPSLGAGLAGGATGAAAGSAVPGIGNVVGGAIGAGLGAGSGSLAVEAGSKYLEVLREAGADLADPDSILRVLTNPETRERALEMGLRRGIPVAVFDAASAGLAGKFLAAAKGATTAQNIRRGLSEAAIQGALGGGGEVAGALSAGERISPGAVFEEVIGEVGPGAVEVGAGVARNRLAAPTPTQPVTFPTQAPTIPSQPVTSPTQAVTQPQVEQPSPASRVALMSDEQRAARLAELTALPSPTAAEAQEAEILRAMVPQTAPATPVVEPQPAPEPAAAVEQPLSAAPESIAPLTSDTAVVPEEVAAPFQPVIPQPAIQPEAQNPQVFFEPPAPVGAGPVATPEEAQTARQIVQFAGAPGSTSTQVEEMLADIGFRDIDRKLNRQERRFLINELERRVREQPALPVSPAAEVMGVPAAEQPVVVPPVAVAPAAPINPTGEASLPTGEAAPVIATPPDIPATPQPSPALVERVETEVVKPKPFKFGTVVEDAPLTVDVHEDPQFENLTPEVASRFTIPGAMDETGNRARTRVGIVLESPDGRYTMTGLLPQQEIASVGAGGRKASGPALQAMAAERRSGGYSKVIEEGGNRSALLADVIAAGYKVRAFIQFQGKPGSIFQRWPNRAAYDAAFGASPRTTRAQMETSALVMPTNTAAEGIERKSVREREATLQKQIDRLARELSSADPARSAEINEEIRALYTQLGELPSFAQESPEGWGALSPQPKESLPAEADRSNDFATVAARLRQTGAQVDVFARSFLQQSLEQEYTRRLAGMEAALAIVPESQRAQIEEQMGKIRAMMPMFARVRGVAYEANHIALGLDDVQNANMADLITLLHEAGHALLKRDPALHGKVINAVNKARADLLAENAERTARIGYNTEVNGNAEELLVQTMAQRMAEEGIPDAPSLAQAIMAWVKDLYYRLAMAVQEAFGREPSPQLALDWFENQLSRWVGGGYDYRFADIFNRFGPEPIGTQFTRHAAAPTGPSTPGNLTNYHNQIADRVDQPATVPQSADDIAWNLRFATEAMPDSTGREGDLDIPRPEAQARIMGAAIAEEAGVADELFTAAQADNADLTYDQWWAAVGQGESPRARLAALEQSVPGSATARIDGERMTAAMTGLARVQAKQLIYRLRSSVQQKLARGQEQTAKAERELLATARQMNRMEAGLRDATLHEATLRDALKEQIRELSKGIRRGLDTAARGGALAQAVRDAESLADSDPIPAEYQRVFERVLADEIPVFDYVDAIAQLELPLADMTAPEFYDAIEANAAGNPVLDRLTERRNKPLLVALRSLLKRNAEQVDMLRLRRADAAEFVRVNGELKDIRSASEERLKELAATIRADRRATTYADRLKRAYVEKRTKLRDAQRTIQEAEAKRTMLTDAQEAIRAKVEELETGGLAAPSEWMPRAGETYLAMRQDAEGGWTSDTRVLQFTREGPPVNAEQMRRDLAANWRYLKDNQDKAGSRTYELVKRQTQELAAIDVNRTYPESKRVFFERWLLPSADAIMTGGGAGAARVGQMLKKFQFITFSNWENDLFKPSLEWSNRLREVARASGLRDPQAFLDEVYDPVLYLIQSEPGLEEGPALREAVRAARRRLPGEVAENFEPLFRDFLVRTRELSERFVKIAEESGVFVEDQRIGGDLRRAVARGWLTTMRRMKASTVSTILREMDGAGWRLQFSSENGAVGPDTFDRGTAEGKRVVRSSTFDALMPERAANEETGAAASGVLDNPELFAKAISGFFTPGIVNRWLVPFVNKPGDPIFTDARGEPIDPLVVQQAWADAGGSVAGWIDLLGQRTGLEPAQEGAALTPEGEWRQSMLRQIESLYLMESRIAADANQVRNLFDPSGRPAHLLMDARENDLLPPEHVEHVGFDPISSRNLLATLAFHASFGRNGRDMEAALNEIKSDLMARKQAYQQLRGSTEAERKRNAEARGLNYRDLKQAAQVYNQVEEGEQTLRAAFGFGNEAGVMGDMRTPLQLLAFVAGQTTNSPKTGLLNLLQLTQRMIARRTVDPVALRDTARAGGEVVKQFYGSLLENFGLHMVRATRHAKDIGAVQGQGFGQLPWTEVLGVGAGKRGEETPTAINMMRTFSALQRKGVRVGFGEAQEFPRYGNVPFLANTMGSISLAAAISNGTAEATSVESLVKAAMDYFAANPQDMANPNFKLTAKDLRAASAAWFSSPGSFDYFQRALVDYGMGTLEDMARGAMERARVGEPILTKDQVLKAAMLAGNELDLQSSINTNPGSWAANPILKFATPLLGYPIRAMAQVHSAMRKPDGTFATRQALKTLGILAAWSLPVGLAFTLMTDLYDEEIIKKKSNLGQISADLPARDNAIAVLQRLSRAGNIYGLGADFVSSVLAGMDPTSGQRAFSLDSRILAFSQLRTIADAIGNFISSDYALTYAGVERPLLQAIGGNGALGAIDIFNGVLGFDNQQARITSRTNVQQWLRAAGREAGIELARGGGGSVQATPVGTWTREMLLASLSNDRLAFLDAYRRAVDAAREAGAPDPEKKVLESWRSRSPLEVFRTKPSEQELQKALNLMSDDGKKAVRDALRLYEQYTDMISPSDAERARDRVLQSMRRPQMDLNSIRRQLAGGALTVR